MDNKELDKSRAEFEAEMRRLDIGPYALVRDESGDYVSEQTQAYWGGFQLAHRSLPVDAAGIKTWRERLLPGYEECDEREARDAEVAELRAALARAGSAAPTAAEGPSLRGADQEAKRTFDDRFKNDSHFGWKPLDYWQGGYSAALARTAAPVCPSGYRLVPMVPTEDMVVAFAETWFSKVRCIDDHDMTDAYAAMLDAAPLPTKEGAGEVDAKDARIAALRLALQEISEVRFGHEGDCGTTRIADDALYADEQSIAAQPKDATDTKEKA